MKGEYYVYDHISPSGKHYIGITRQEPKKRWGKNGCNYLSCKKGKKQHPVFAAAILKYGWDNFEHKILFHNCTEELAKKLEVAFIAYWTDLGLAYNIQPGGDLGCRRKLTNEERTAHKKECRNRYHRENRDKENAQHKVYKAANKDKIKAYNEAYKEEIKLRRHLYYEAHKEAAAAQCRAWREAHKNLAQKENDINV